MFFSPVNKTGNVIPKQDSGMRTERLKRDAMNQGKMNNSVVGQESGTILNHSIQRRLNGVRNRGYIVPPKVTSK
mgnify:CR=1 FL=1|tara:strand:+ start:402 stop:623 length:222 start_codon:yes stop_codon:yes gene_type:complete